MDANVNKCKCVYFAHPITHYNSEFEWECIETILHMLTPIGEDSSEGLIHIMNPNQIWLGNLYKERKKSMEPSSAFEIFSEIAQACDIIVGVTFFDGTLGAGVASEMKTGIKNNKPVYLIFVDNFIKLFMPVSIMNYKVLTIEETREKIKDEEM